jgi:hypothetical protein
MHGERGVQGLEYPVHKVFLERVLAGRWDIRI